MSVKSKRWFRFAAVAVVLLVMAFGYRSCTRTEVVAEFFDETNEDLTRVQLVKRSVMFTGSVWDLRVEVYNGKILVGVETVLKHRDSVDDFPKIVDVKYNDVGDQLSVDFERDAKRYRISLTVRDGEYSLDDYIESGRAVEYDHSGE